MKREIEIGQRFDKLVVIERITLKNKNPFWLCQCDCGNTKEVLSFYLLHDRPNRGHSCGCAVGKKPAKISEINWDTTLTDFVPMSPSFKSLVGKKFGKLTPLFPIKSTSHGRVTYQCKCECGTILERSSTVLKKHHDTASCGCSLGGIGSKNYKGHGDVTGTHWASIVSSATVRNLECTITKEYIWELFLQQEKRCSISGIPLEMSSYKTTRTASLDRIDSSKGYIEGNVQWIHKKLNVMKMSFKQTKFIGMMAVSIKYQMQQHNCSTVDELITKLKELK